MRVLRTENRESARSIAPKPHFLLALANQPWDAKGAISEFVDNSFGRQRGNANTVKITYDKTKRVLVVFDDGQGMEDIIKAFRLGDTAGLGPADIGRYGCGGTMAMIWLAEKVRMWTMRDDGKMMHDEVVWRQIMQAESLADVLIGNGKWENATIANTPADLLEAGHGTWIELFLRRERIIAADAIQHELARIYAPGLRSGRSIIWRTAGPRAVTQALMDNSMPPMPRDGAKIAKFKLVIEHEGRQLPIEGRIGLYDNVSLPNSYVAIGFGPRVILKTKDCFSTSNADGGKERFSGRGIVGYIDLGEGWQEYLTTTKTNIHDDHLRKKLMEVIFERIKPLLERTEDERLQIVLEGLAVELQSALNNLADQKFAVAVVPVLVEFETEADPDKPPRPRQPGPHQPRPKPDHPAERGKQAVSTISLALMNDEDMEGTLCRLEFDNQNNTKLQVLVNEDHPVVLEMLKAEPINKMALNLMVTREIASTLIRTPGALKDKLHPRLQARLSAADGDIHRERLLARILMDSARRPPIHNEEAA